MSQIIPAILVKDQAAFMDRLHLVENLVPLIQIDVMDGKFVPNTSWCDLGVIKDLDTSTAFELHLMVEDPEIIIRECENIPKVKRLVWHLESMGDHRELLNLVHSFGREAGLAISPKTPVDSLQPYTGRMDEILVLGVEPGFSGQGLIPETIVKTKQIHERWNDLVIAFDGGVNLANIEDLKQAGVTRFCVASAVFGNQDIETALKELQNN
ncbi:MAG: hypothetical protein ABIB04_00590 [Patescibacteria group bacterium]